MGRGGNAVSPRVEYAGMEFWNFCKNWLFGFLGIDLLMGALERGEPIPAQAYVQLVFSGVTLLVGVLCCYRFFYNLVGLFSKGRKFPAQKKDNKYAFILSARNEQAVLGNLIDSIRAQDYPQELIDIYVVADNCDPDDKTAQIAREKGCFVYERHDKEHARKGYALEWLTRQMAKTMNLEEAYYAYVFFDSDNVLAPTYLTKLNDAMVSENFGVCMGYRNIKNLNENWVTAINGVNMYRNTVSVCRPRAVLKSPAQIINGTGFALRSYILKDGWYGHEIAEDGEISANVTLQGVKFGFCEEAEYYDEQPASLKISFRQRIRWCKGALINWWKSGHKILASFFKKPTWQKYDAYWDYFPYAFFSFLWPLLYQIVTLILMAATGQNAWASFLNYIISTLVGMYVGGFFTSCIVLIREWKKVHFTFWQGLLVGFVWPFYDMSGIVLNIVCLFMRVKWKPIPHKVVADAKDLLAVEEKRGKRK